MVVGLLVLVAVLAVALYLLVIFRAVPGAVEERLGELEELPQGLGKWHPDETSPEGQAANESGERREVRYWYDEAAGLFGRGKIVKQVRYRDAETNEIVRVDPDARVTRKRIKP